MTSLLSIVDFLDAGDRLRWNGEPAPELDIAGPAPLRDAGPDQVTFAGRAATEQDLAQSRAGLLILDSRHGGHEVGARATVLSDHARRDVARVIRRFYPPDQPPAGVHPTAYVSPSATVDPTASIGPMVFVDEGVRIGEGCVLEAGVRVLRGSVLRRNVRVQPGAVIGAEGLSFERAEDGTPERFPQLGGVVLEDEVDVGTNCVIERGAFADTILRRGVKLGQMCVVGHNCDIGEGVFMVGLCGTAGSAIIGKGTWLGPLTVVRDGVTVGAESFIGMQASVTRSLPEHSRVLSVPSRVITPSDSPSATEPED